MNEQGVDFLGSNILTIGEVLMGVFLVVFIILSLTKWRRFEMFLAVRYLRAKRRSRAISIISIISVVGVALGVGVLSIVLAVMNGFERDLQTKILGTNAHIVIHKQTHSPIKDSEDLLARVQSEPHVTGAVPFIFSEGLASSPSDTIGIMLRGIDPKLEDSVAKTSRSLISGRWEFAGKLEDAREPGKFVDAEGVVIGSELAGSLMVEVGDPIELLSSRIGGIKIGEDPFISKTFVVTGIFSSGLYEYDSKLVYMTLGSAQAMFGMKDMIGGVEVWVDDIYKANEVAKSLNDKLGYPYFARDWINLNYTFFSALRLEKTVMFIILVLIVLVAAFNIASTLIMIVIEKRKEIGILKSMGATRGSIMRIFMGQGMMIGLVGTIIGAVLGYFGCELLRRYQFVELPADIYLVDRLPVFWSMSDVLLICVASMGIALIATLGPALMAARYEPVEAIRYE
jgi:lipoprotein-releasing system permease protein